MLLNERLFEELDDCEECKDEELKEAGNFDGLDGDDIVQDVYSRMPSNVKDRMNKFWDGNYADSNWFSGYLTGLVDTGLINSDEAAAFEESNKKNGYYNESCDKELKEAKSYRKNLSNNGKKYHMMNYIALPPDESKNNANGIITESVNDDNPLDMALMSFESGHRFERGDFKNNSEFNKYNAYMEMGPFGFYDEFKDELDFTQDFIDEYGDKDVYGYDDEEDIEESVKTKQDQELTEKAWKIQVPEETARNFRDALEAEDLAGAAKELQGILDFLENELGDDAAYEIDDIRSALAGIDIDRDPDDTVSWADDDDEDYTVGDDFDDNVLTPLWDLLDEYNVWMPV